MFSLSVPVAHLAAALHIAAVKDIRYYLNGVLLDAKSNNVVATDGNMMLCTRQDTILPIDGSDQVDVILPYDFVAKVVREHKRDDGVLITIDGTECRTAACIGKIVDGRFPDWRRIYPHTLAHAADVQFDKDLIARVTKAAKSLGARSGCYPIRTDEKETSAVAVIGEGQAHVVIMPIRETEKAKFPEFVRFAV